MENKILIIEHFRPPMMSTVLWLDSSILDKRTLKFLASDKTWRNVTCKIDMSDIAELEAMFVKKTALPTISDIATKTWTQLLGYLVADDISDVVRSSALSSYATLNWVSTQGFLTEHQSLANYDTKEEVTLKINTAVSSVYKYKGSVASASALPTTNVNTGDVYDVQDTGMNYAWTGTAWDALGMNIVTDLEGYATEEWVEDKNYLTAHLDISDRVTYTDLYKTFQSRETIKIINSDADVLSVIDGYKVGDTGVLEAAEGYSTAVLKFTGTDYRILFRSSKLDNENPNYTLRSSLYLNGTNYLALGLDSTKIAGHGTRTAMDTTVTRTAYCDLIYITYKNTSGQFLIAVATTTYTKVLEDKLLDKITFTVTFNDNTLLDIDMYGFKGSVIALETASEETNT